MKKKAIDLFLYLYQLFKEGINLGGLLMVFLVACLWLATRRRLKPASSRRQDVESFGNADMSHKRLLSYIIMIDADPSANTWVGGSAITSYSEWFEGLSTIMKILN